MKKIFIVLATSFLIISFIISSFLVIKVNKKNKDLEKQIISINNSIKEEEKVLEENKKTLNSLEENESFKVDELSIWKKAEEKLQQALN